ncbi:MAG: hypothetical protein HRU09_15210, partial [Oligoflexales bacterium]|nr:hypothetical protein [Oligoflexales bacterium]
ECAITGQNCTKINHQWVGHLFGVTLLSHSAVVARELGLPTIVGVNGSLVNSVSTGMRVRVDAGKGEVKILEQ